MSTGPVRRQPFDAFEVARVGEYHFPGDDETYFERDDMRDYTQDEECIGTIITLYGHRTWPEPDGFSVPVPEDTDGYGLTAIADFEDNEDGRARAIDLAHALAGVSRVDRPAVYIYLEGGNA